MAESVSSIRTFMHSSSRIAAARKLRGREAQSLIDVIDRVCGPSLQRDGVWGTNLGCRPSHCQNWMRTSGSNVCTCFTNSAKLVNYCQPHMLCEKSLYASVTSTVPAGTPMSAEGSTWGVMWPSNNSDLGRRTSSTRFSRYAGYNPLAIAHRCSSCRVAVLPRDHRLEAPVSPKHLAVVGSFYLHRSPELPHRL